MKYYAVTDDPNELMHYGIKGMKWGVIRTDAQLGHPKKPSTRTRSSKPRSPAYMKASAKLSSAMQRGIAKAQKSWNVYNSPENKQLRAEKRAVNKAIRDFNRGERQFEKHVQLARQGRLKYKGISDAEVQRITDRLALERNARILSGTEKQSFRRRLNESIGAGIVQGVGQGMATRASEWIGRGSKLKTQRLMTEQANRLHDQQAARDFARSMWETKVRDADKQSRDLKNAYEQMAAEEGVHVRKHFIRDKTKRKLLYDMQQKRENENYDTDTKRKLEYKKEELKLQAKYKKDKDKKKNKNGSDDNNAPDDVIADAPIVTPHPSAKRNRSYTDTQYNMIRSAGESSQIRKSDQRSQLNDLIQRSQQNIDDVIQEESRLATEQYRARVHDWANAVERASERKQAQDAARKRTELAEQGWRDRESRLAYRQGMHDLAAERAHDIRTSRHSSGPGARISRVTRYGNTYSVETPLFIDEEHRNGHPYRRTKGRR